MISNDMLDGSFIENRRMQVKIKLNKLKSTNRSFCYSYFVSLLPVYIYTGCNIFTKCNKVKIII